MFVYCFCSVVHFSKSETYLLISITQWPIREALVSQTGAQMALGTGDPMALFHCMVRHGTVRYGSLLGGFPLGTVPGT